jgi:hypothetical protein
MALSFAHSTLLNLLVKYVSTVLTINSLFLYQWSSDSLDKRELAGKLAKLNAIELAKFSRRVTGQPSYPCSF